MKFSGVPGSDIAVPDVVRRMAGDRPTRPVWLNELDGLTFEITTGTGRWFVKWAPSGSGLDLAREAARLRWAARFTPVPVVLDQGTDESGDWLLTEGLPGENAVSDRWKAEPATAVVALARGLRHLHDVLPVTSCPFSWSAEERIVRVRRRAAAGTIELGDQARRAGADVAAVLSRLDRVPEVDRLVVCHGDACAPNTLLAADGTWCGHVDLGSLGVADRWADLAVASWSLSWNYGPGWEELFFDAYGVTVDRQRLDYYRLLWELG